jgi:hypothetical protein
MTLRHARRRAGQVLEVVQEVAEIKTEIEHIDRTAGADDRPPPAARRPALRPPLTLDCLCGRRRGRPAA